jgi:tetratricopeptide (TPR) repeat protein
MKTCLVLAAAVVFSVACSNPEAAKREYFESGNKFAAEGNLSEAILQYRNALQLDPRFGEARWQMGLAYEQQRSPAALGEFIRAADLMPERTDVQLKAGTYLLVAGRFEDANARAMHVLKAEPANVQALQLRANSAARLKDPSDAIRELEEAMKTQSDYRLHTGLGALMVAKGNVVEAEAAFKQALVLNPKSVELRLGLANFYWSLERHAESEKLLKEARELEPSHPLLNRMLAMFYVTTGRSREAEEPLKAFAASSTDGASKLLLADYYVALKRPEDAATVLKPLLERPDTATAATLRLAEVEWNSNQHDSARKRLNDLVAKVPGNAEALTMLSGWHLRDQDVQEALRTGRAAVQADPSSAQAHFALGQAYVANRQRDEAIKSLNEVLRINPRVVSAQVLLSRLQLAAGDAESAERLAADARKAVPDNLNVRVVLARSLLARNRLREAEVEVNALLAARPELADAHALSGRVLLAKQDRTGAARAFARALEKNPDSTEALDGMLTLDVETKNVAAAVTRIEKRLAARPDDPGLQFIAAKSYAAAGQSDKSEGALRSVIRLDPSNLTAYQLLGRMLVRQKRLDEALVELDKAATQNPAQVGVATMAAMIVEMQNRLPEAQKRYEAIVAASLQAPVAANNLAWIYSEHGGNLDVALQLAQSAKTQMPENAEVNDTLGWIYYKKDLPKLAIPLLEDAVGKIPARTLFQYHLGLAYAKAGEAAKAKTVLAQALKLEPNLPEAAEARKVLGTQ